MTSQLILVGHHGNHYANEVKFHNLLYFYAVNKCLKCDEDLFNIQ